MLDPEASRLTAFMFSAGLWVVPGRHGSTPSCVALDCRTSLVAGTCESGGDELGFSLSRLFDRIKATKEQAGSSGRKSQTMTGSDSSSRLE